MTALGMTVCFGAAFIGIFNLSTANPIAKFSAIVVPVGLLVFAALFMVRGYSLMDHALIIHRLGWSSRFDLSSLSSAVVDPSLSLNSIRLAGNGGLFSFWGRYYNEKLGNYRVFGTDPRRSVVLKFPNRVLVVTPDDPDAFAAEIINSK